MFGGIPNNQALQTREERGLTIIRHPKRERQRYSWSSSIPNVRGKGTHNNKAPQTWEAREQIVFSFSTTYLECLQRLITRPVLPDRGWNLPSPYLPVWSRKTKTQWLPLSVTSLLRVMPKMYEDERFELVISRRPRLDRLFWSFEVL